MTPETSYEVVAIATRTYELGPTKPRTTRGFPPDDPRTRAILAGMTAGPIVADATDLEHRPAVFPQLVADLERLGFASIGRFASLMAPSRADRCYGRDERARLSEWRMRPAFTVLRATDGSAFAGVDSLGDARVLRLRTELADGSLVETVGVDPDGILRPRPWIDAYGGFTSVHTDDRSVLLLHDASADVVVPAHADHLQQAVARRAADPVPHSDRDHALHLWTRSAAHVGRNQARAVKVARSLMTVVAILLVGPLLWWQVTGARTLPSVLLADGLVLLAFLVLGPLVARLVGRRRWWRAPYLA